MKLSLLLAKLLLISVLGLASFARVGWGAYRKDQSSGPPSFYATQGSLQTIVKGRIRDANQQITRCNILILGSVVALTGMVMYERKRAAAHSQ